MDDLDREILGALRQNARLPVASLAAMTGAQTDRMTRDDAWRLLSIGRHIERLSFLANALLAGFQNHAVHEVSGFEAMVALFDSTITFHARYQQRRDVATLVDLLVLDAENPRSLAWVTQTLRGRIARLAGSAPGKLTALSYELPDPATWTLEHLCDPGPADGEDGPYAALAALLVGTGVLYLWGLGESGYANSFYSAAAQAGSESWKALFFGASDAAGSVTVDKPPLALWPLDVERGYRAALFLMTEFVRTAPPGCELPVLIEPAYAGEPLLDALPRLREDLLRQVQRVGGVLLRGFDVPSVAAFQQFSAAFAPLQNYEFGSTPRTAVSS
eukprot:gene32900-37160_t